VAHGEDAGTGDPAVDAVLASLDGLEERPVAEHVPTYESACGALQQALAGADSLHG